jgi:hypothetical protein
VERQRKVEHAQQYTDRAVQALSKAKLTLQTLQPDALIFEAKPGQSAIRVQEAVMKYQEHRPALTEVAFGHPDQKLRDALTNVDERAFSVFSSTTVFILSFSPGYAEKMQDQIVELRNEALAAFNEFMASVDNALSLLHADG